MTQTAVTMPRFKLVAATLRKTTEHLARELVQPTSVPPNWNEFEWAVAQSAAAMQGISVLLANTLSWSGPPQWRSFLTEQLEQSVARDSRIDALIKQLDAATNEAQTACVALKGSSLRALNIYGPGERPMGDIDLLVRSTDVDSLAIALKNIGYSPSRISDRHTIYEPQYMAAPLSFGEHADHSVIIEIHTDVSEPLPVRKVDITDSMFPETLRPGLNTYPSIAALALHLLLHAAGNMRAHALRQIQLHDIFAISPRLNDADWHTITMDPHTNKRRWWLYPVLALTESYYTGTIPTDVLRETRITCPRALRFTIDRQILTDVSWSNLRIHAFPGIAWSRTPSDALRFIRSRALPSRATLVELKEYHQAQPHLHKLRWYGLSHSNRIFRWLFSRPPRVQTMASVKAALEDAGILPD